MLLAKLHEHAQQWELASTLVRPTLDTEGIFGPAGLLDREGSARDLGPDVAADLRQLRRRLEEADAHLGREASRFGLIHFDLSFGNVLFFGNDVRPIDFDDCGFGHFLMDLAVVLAGPWERPGFTERRSALLSGYRQVRPLPEEHIWTLPVFMAVRAALLSQWDRVRHLLRDPESVLT